MLVTSSVKFIVSVPPVKLVDARVFTVAPSKGVPSKLSRLNGRHSVFHLPSL